MYCCRGTSPPQERLRQRIPSAPAEHGRGRRNQHRNRHHPSTRNRRTRTDGDKATTSRTRPPTRKTRSSSEGRKPSHQPHTTAPAANAEPETERKETTDTAQTPKKKTTATLTPDLGVHLTLCYVRKQWSATPLRETNRRRAVTGSNDYHQPTKCGEELPTLEPTAASRTASKGRIGKLFLVLQYSCNTLTLIGDRLN